MKVGTITKPNQKGQIVIPKKLREALDIDKDVPLNLVLRGRGIYMFPVDEVFTRTETENSYLEILNKTQGAWAQDNWPQGRKKRRRKELAASQKRKKPW